MTKIGQLIERAISRYGSEAKLAEAAGVSQPSVNQAKRLGRCGTKLAMGIERATNGEISKSDLRPDLWPAEVTGDKSISSLIAESQVP